MFFVNRAIEVQSARLLKCTERGLLQTAMSQYAFEVSVFTASQVHVDRTYDEGAAQVHLLPLLPFVSSRTRECDGQTHDERMQAALRAVERIPRHMPIVITCTCVMQKSIFGDVLDKLHSFPNVVQLAKSTRPYPMSVSTNVIVVPYFSIHQAQAACMEDGRVYWRGSPSVANAQATRVRRHIMDFQRHPAYDVAASTRSKCTGPHSRCINGFGAGSHRALKQEMRKEMALRQFCLVPEGDSPESSRLADAVSALCTPIVISSRIAVLRSEAWEDKVVTIEPGEFLRMSDDDVARRARAANITCSMRLQLRHETSANTILHRIGELVNESLRSHVNSVIG